MSSPYKQTGVCIRFGMLLVHGKADNNTGSTYPIPSERYCNPLKEFGATTRLVLLPYESHHYDA